VLALICSSGSRRNLVLTPDHLIDQWEGELKRCTPGLTYTVFSDRTLPSQLLAGMMSAQEGSWRCLYDGDHDLIFMTLSCFASVLPLQQQVRPGRWTPVTTGDIRYKPPLARHPF
jgi:hypothetical protein